MTAQEMHIQFEQKAGSLGGASLFAYMPDAIDFQLTTAQDKLIREQIKPKPLWRVGLQGVQEKYDAVKGFVETKEIPLIEFGEAHNHKYGVGVLPDNYFMLLQDSSNVICANNVLPEEKQYYVATIPFTKDVRNIATKYKDFNIHLLWSDSFENIYFNLSEFPDINTIGFNDADEYYFIVNLIRRFKPKIVVPAQGGGEVTVEVYWEKWHNIYKPNSFIFVSYVSKGTANRNPIVVRLRYDETIVATSHFAATTKHEILSGSNKVVESQNRLVQQEDLGFILNNTLFTSNTASPISELIGNLIKVYFPRKAAINSVRMTYICKPMAVSLKYGLNSEIDELLHDRLVDIAVMQYLASIPSQKFQGLKQENMLIE
jgi:hypothetical protein